MAGAVAVPSADLALFVPSRTSSTSLACTDRLWARSFPHCLEGSRSGMKPRRGRARPWQGSASGGSWWRLQFRDGTRCGCISTKQTIGSKQSNQEETRSNPDGSDMRYPSKTLAVRDQQSKPNAATKQAACKYLIQHTLTTFGITYTLVWGQSICGATAQTCEPDSTGFLVLWPSRVPEWKVFSETGWTLSGTKV